MEIKEEYLRAFFQRNEDYYLEKWYDFQNGKKISFKPYALLFGLFWFAYRKMYYEIIFILLVIFVETWVEDFILTNYFPHLASQSTLISFVYNIIAGSILGFTGNYFYMLNTKRKIEKILLQTDISEEETLEEMRKSGGISWRFLYFIIVGIILFMFYYRFTYGY